MAGCSLVAAWLKPSCRLQAGFWLAVVGWLWVCCWLAAGYWVLKSCLLTACWLCVGVRLAADWQLAVGWLLDCCWTAAGWLLAGCWIAADWLLAAGCPRAHVRHLIGRSCSRTTLRLRHWDRPQTTSRYWSRSRLTWHHWSRPRLTSRLPSRSCCALAPLEPLTQEIAIRPTCCCTRRGTHRRLL